MYNLNFIIKKAICFTTKPLTQDAKVHPYVGVEIQTPNKEKNMDVYFAHSESNIIECSRKQKFNSLNKTINNNLSTNLRFRTSQTNKINNEYCAELGIKQKQKLVYNFDASCSTFQVSGYPSKNKPFKLLLRLRYLNQVTNLHIEGVAKYYVNIWDDFTKNMDVERNKYNLCTTKQVWIPIYANTMDSHHHQSTGRILLQWTLSKPLTTFIIEYRALHNVYLLRLNAQLNWYKSIEDKQRVKSIEKDRSKSQLVHEKSSQNKFVASISQIAQHSSMFASSGKYNSLNNSLVRKNSISKKLSTVLNRSRKDSNMKSMADITATISFTEDENETSQYQNFFKRAPYYHLNPNSTGWSPPLDSRSKAYYKLVQSKPFREHLSCLSDAAWRAMQLHKQETAYSNDLDIKVPVTKKISKYASHTARIPPNNSVHIVPTKYIKCKVPN